VIRERSQRPADRQSRQAHLAAPAIADCVVRVEAWLAITVVSGLEPTPRSLDNRQTNHTPRLLSAAAPDPNSAGIGAPRKPPPP
jgi:hypothetical protein